MNNSNKFGCYDRDPRDSGQMVWQGVLVYGDSAHRIVAYAANAEGPCCRHAFLRGSLELGRHFAGAGAA